MSALPTQEEAVSARADLITTVLLVGLGLAVFYFSWTMDRLEMRRIHPATIPGLVPMFLGAALTLCGGLLALRSARLAQPGAWKGLLDALVSMPAGRVLILLGLCLTHTLLLMGRMPFWLASSLFVFSFILVYEVFLSETLQPLWRTLIWALVVALIGGVGIFLVFERIFLVRLP